MLRQLWRAPPVNHILRRELVLHSHLGPRRCAYASQPTSKKPSTMGKRKASTTESPTKRAKPEPPPEYHLTPSVKNEDGSIQWPAPRREMERAREIILEA
jgi:hypothetical protein